MSKEFRVFGPPGCGKTSRLATRDIPRAVEKYGSENVMVTSYTRAAAKEISFKKSRETGHTISVASENVGTIHSILFHAMGQPEITEVHYVGDWNKKYPQMKISGKAANLVDEVFAGESHRNESGDRLLSMINVKRNRMLDINNTRIPWSPDMKSFYKKWVEFKEDTKSMDFTDLIESGLYEFDSAPNKPNVIFVDEAQDFTKLQLSVIRKWGENTDWIILTGDDDQTIFSFIGSTPDSMLDPPISEAFKTVLKRSYRVPRLVLNRAERLIKQVSKREPKIYLPRLEDDEKTEAIGELVIFKQTYNDTRSFIKHMTKYLKKDMSIAFLATCSYMLEPLKMELREQAIPFHNQYRRRRKDWNPLFQHGTLSAFMDKGPDQDFWTVHQFVEWAKHLKVGEHGLVRKVGKKGIKRLQEAINEMEPGLESCREVLSLILEPQAINAALARDLDWYVKNVGSAKAESLKYPVRVLKKLGREAIEKDPLITLGTIHSVKGATFDVVYLFPDISYLADMEMGFTEGRDYMYRVFYVGMTRAKHSLVLCEQTARLTKSPVPRMYVPL